MKKRIYRLRNILKKNNINNFLVTNQTNIHYLLEEKFIPSYLLFTEKNNYIFLSSLFLNVSNTYDFKVIIYRNDFIQRLVQTLKNEKVKILYCEGGISYNLFQNIKDLLKIKISIKNDLVENLRLIKDKNEIKLIKKSCKIATSTFKEIKNLVLKEKNITEKEVADEIEYILRKKGAYSSSFHPIVASGLHTVNPHHTPSNKKVHSNGPLLIDLGANFRGYASDLTRIIFLGKINSQYLNLYNNIYHIIKYLIVHTYEGMRFSTLENLSKQLFIKFNLHNFVLHSIGHGVGLEVHEKPYPYDNIILKESMVFTIEPGVYVPGVGGVRIEETILLKKDGAEVLTNL